jgi:hypothetical protein
MWKIYTRRFLPRFWNDLSESVRRDLLIGFLIAGGTVALQFYAGVITTNLRTNIGTVLLPYVGIFLLYVIYHIAHTVVTIHTEDQVRINELQGLLETAQQAGTDAQSGATPVDWGHARYRFENLANKGLTARITTENSGYSFAVSGATKNDRLEAEALCRNAGVLLMKSAVVRTSMPDHILRQSDDVTRWLLWIVNSHSIEASVSGESADGSKWKGWRIEDLIRSCSIACTQCWSALSSGG